MKKTDVQAIDQRIRGQTDPEPFSGIVQLTEGERVLFEGCYGLAIRAESIPVRANTRFQMASGCKVFTAVAACQLVESGLIEWDTPLIDCVGRTFPNWDPQVTVRHLLTHSSGITSYFQEDVNDDYEALWQDLPMYRVRRPADFLPLFEHKGMRFPPGGRFEYNDGGYILLGLAIEGVTRQPFAEVVQERVLDAAGMDDSGYFASDQLPGGTAYAYIHNPDGSWRTNLFAVPALGGPDGGAYTTAPDMDRFWRALHSGRLLRPETVREMTAPQIATSEDAPHGDYGYGVWIDRRQEWAKVFVEGYDPGVALRSAFYPQRDRVLTLIGNTDRALWRLFNQIEPLALGHSPD